MSNCYATVLRCLHVKKGYKSELCMYLEWNFSHWSCWMNVLCSNCIHSQKRTSCSKSTACLLTGSHQADIRMRSHRLLRFDDNRSATSCQQAWCKFVKTFHPQVWWKLFQQPAASLQISICNKSDFHRLGEFNRLQQRIWQYNWMV